MKRVGGKQVVRKAIFLYIYLFPEEEKTLAPLISVFVSRDRFSYESFIRVSSFFLQVAQLRMSHFLFNFCFCLQYGLYASFMASFVYIIFGSCKSITIGPTAIMATMVRPLVLGYGADMAILLTFLKGCIIALLGLFHLGEFPLRCTLLTFYFYFLFSENKLHCIFCM